MNETASSLWVLIVKAPDKPVLTYQVTESAARACLDYAEHTDDIVIAYEAQL